LWKKASRKLGFLEELRNQVRWNFGTSGIWPTRKEGWEELSFYSGRVGRFLEPLTCGTFSILRKNFPKRNFNLISQIGGEGSLAPLVWLKGFG